MKVLALIFFIVFTINNSYAIDPLKDSIAMSASALKAQSKRLEVTAENIANAQTTGLTPGAKPYQRKTIYFKTGKGSKGKARTIRIAKIGVDKSEFIKKYEPYHPAADIDGYVSYPNVNTNIESADAREAQRSYNANLNVIEIARAMTNKTLDVLR
ncbi:MAG: flagellar basal body rod protein FlgC [Alphaproteobacteria bacterium]